MVVQNFHDTVYSDNVCLNCQHVIFCFDRTLWCSGVSFNVKCLFSESCTVCMQISVKLHFLPVSYSYSLLFESLIISMLQVNGNKN